MDDAPSDLKSLLRDPLRWLQARVHRRLVDAGYGDLRPAHADVFQFLDDAHGSRVQDLAARAQMTWQSMAELVAHLEAAGYVARQPDPLDRRARVVHLTDKGRLLTPIAIGAMREIEQEWAAHVGPDELEQVRRTLRSLWPHIQD